MKLNVCVYNVGLLYLKFGIVNVGAYYLKSGMYGCEFEFCLGCVRVEGV